MKRITKIKIFGTSLGAAALFVIVGIVFWGGFHTVLEVTNQQWFCTSCHEMTWVTEEWSERVHSSNRSGVLTTCADCHVPREWGPKMIRKIEASRELWGKLVGTINTEEKFEAKRLVLAERVWSSMLRTDSRECRNCHEWQGMDLEAQDQRAARTHVRAFEEGRTCIQCHQGIAHELPEDWEDSPIWAIVDDDVEPVPAEPVRDTEPVTPARVVEGVVSSDTARNLDWSAVPVKELVLFYPGQTSIEWMQDGSAHSGGRAFGMGDRCIMCHEGEERQIGETALSPDNELDRTPIPGKRPSVDLSVQAVYDEDHLHMRFQWPEGEHVPVPFADGGKLDPDHPFRLTVSFATDAVALASQAGCWASCHHDSRHMPDAPDADAIAESGLAERLGLNGGVTKYLSETRTEIEIRGRRGAARGGWDKLKDDEELAELMNSGVFLDLAQLRVGTDGIESLNGHVLYKREFAQSDGVDFAAELEDGVWTAWMTRALATGETDDIGLDTGRLYNIGIALHDDHSISRFHHISWQYLLGFDNEDAEINAVSAE